MVKDKNEINADVVCGIYGVLSEKDLIPLFE